MRKSVSNYVRHWKMEQRNWLARLVTNYVHDESEVTQKENSGLSLTLFRPFLSFHFFLSLLSLFVFHKVLWGCYTLKLIYVDRPVSRPLPTHSINAEKKAMTLVGFEATIPYVWAVEDITHLRIYDQWSESSCAILINQLKLTRSICTTWFNIPELCILHTECLCFVWFSVYKTAVSLNCVNWLIFAFPVRYKLNCCRKFQSLRR
jgi:hypothetical protein